MLGEWWKNHILPQHSEERASVALEQVGASFGRRPLNIDGYGHGDLLHRFEDKYFEWRLSDRYIYRGFRTH